MDESADGRVSFLASLIHSINEEYFTKGSLVITYGAASYFASCIRIIGIDTLTRGMEIGPGKEPLLRYNGPTMKLLRGPMGFITATMFLNFMGLTIIIPVIPYIVAQYTTHVALYVGLITSFGALCQFLSGPALGYASDVFGRRPVVLWSLFGGVIGYVVFGIGARCGSCS